MKHIQGFQQLLDLAEDVDFDGEEYVAQLKEQMSRAFDTFTETMQELSGICIYYTL